MVLLRAREARRRWHWFVLVLLVVAYLGVGTLWIFSGGPVADAVGAASSIPHWVDEVGKGVLLALVAAVGLQVVAMRRRAERLDDAIARHDEAARQLVDSEDRNALQATALSGTANAVVITDTDGTIEWVNAAFERMSGYPASVAVGATPRLVNSGLQDEAFYRDLWETILEGRVWRGQVVNRRRDGELYTVSQTITPVAAGSRGGQKFVAIHEDITERVRAERELEASRLRLQALFDNALDAIVLADDQGRYIDVNPAACELSGYSRDELLHMQAGDLAARDGQSVDVADQFDRFLRAGTDIGTFALRHKDGHSVETEYRAVSNILPGVHLSILRDVSGRNRMSRALTVAESEFRELAENAADIVAKLHIDGDATMQIDYVNPAATAVLGYPREQFYADPDLLLALFDRRGADLDESVGLVPTEMEPTRLAMVHVQRADGRLVWLEVHSTRTDPSTVPVTIQVVARDVTARVETMQALRQAVRDQAVAADQLRELNAMKDTFLQSVSHELRTPLTSILGFAQLLADPRLGLSAADSRDFHDRILTNSQRLQRLLDDLLDVDRFTRGHIEPSRVPTDVTDLIQRMVHDIELDDHPVELDLEPVTMDLDAPWVERIIANLLRNVVRHTPPETRIWIRTRSTLAGITITVDDDGPGIPFADRQRVIEPFQQGPEAAMSAQPGTGIGLSLVKAFAQLHGGGLTITDSPAGGCRMTVNLSHTSEDGSDQGAHSDASPPAGWVQRTGPPVPGSKGSSTA